MSERESMRIRSLVAEDTLYDLAHFASLRGLTLEFIASRLTRAKTHAAAKKLITRALPVLRARGLTVRVEKPSGYNALIGPKPPVSYHVDDPCWRVSFEGSRDG